MAAEALKTNDLFQTSSGVGHHWRPGYYFPSNRYQVATGWHYIPWQLAAAVRWLTTDKLNSLVVCGMSVCITLKITPTHK